MHDSLQGILHREARCDQDGEREAAVGSIEELGLDWKQDSGTIEFLKHKIT
jgi:hypothetical protein